MLRYFFVIPLLLCSNFVFSQNIIVSQNYPQDYFRAPLDLTPIISGSFGELRSNHFHSGMDYKTNQKEGYPVYAVADGFISRLRVQSVGFGNAVYITHPNGFSSVYGHLQRFNDRISQIIKMYQYRIESFEVDFPLLFIEIPVKKGEIIAWSGNSGSSGGPHLHFEIRDTQTEETINPQLFGLTVADRIKPFINGIYLYRLDDQPFTKNTYQQFFQVSGTGGEYKLSPNKVLNAYGEVGFGIVTFDKNSASDNVLGVYSIELFLDEKVIYSSVWERFFFDHSRSINSHLDYPAYITSGKRIQKSFIEPGNPLTLYKNLQNSGSIHLYDTEIHKLKYVITDVAGNTSNLYFSVKNDPLLVIATKKPVLNIPFLFNRENNFNNTNIKIHAPAGCLYRNFDFTYSILPNPAGSYSKIHQIHTRLVPLNNPVDIFIKPDSTLNPELTDKAVIVNTRGTTVISSVDDGFIKGSIREFGNYYLKVDTVAPRISAVNIRDKKMMKGISKIIFNISDNLSGIRSFRATIDNHWVLMEYDAKTARLWHTFDDRTVAGTHQFEMEVVDMKMNRTTFKAGFIK
ncbi:MAG: M23 family metallopeptidase [Flavobacterium sp.]|nr:M23 family metallopeptidase [Pedobacter sp.]